MRRAAVLALLLLCTSPLLYAADLQFENATISATIDGKVSRDIVTLPFRWDLQYPGKAGSAVLEFEFMDKQLPQGPLGIYFPKLGSAYVVSLNGVDIGRDGDLLVPGGQDTGKAPRLLSVDAKLIKPHNILRIQLRADGGRKAGVSAVVIDEWSRVLALFEEYRLWKVWVPGAIAAGHACLAVIGIVLWCLGRREPMEESPVDHGVRGCGAYVLVPAGDGLDLGDASVAWPLWGKCRCLRWVYGVVLVPTFAW